jgi:hypothetical protein
MNSGKNTPRLLGVAFLVVLFLTFSELWIMSIIGTGSISDSLVSVSNNLTPMRISILLGLIDSAAIVVLGVLLFAVLQKQNKTIALVALGCWLLEAIMVAARSLNFYSLLPLSLEFVKAGAPESSYFQTLGLLYTGRWGYDTVLFFFSLGGILSYSLFYRSRSIPRVLSIWGLVGVCLSLIGSSLAILDRDPGPVAYAPNALFELAIGLWLLVKGIKSYEPAD